ncbi:14985_t:CDS:2, partial [Gigaspora rosea]
MSKRPHLSIKLISLGQIMPSIFLYPIRIGWQTVFEQNNKWFYMHITEGHESSETEPGYRSQSGSNYSNIEATPRWDDSELLELSLEGVQFRPFAFKIEKFLLYVISLGIGSNIEMMGAGIGYMSSFYCEESEKQFENFFSDKNIVNLSSYKVDKYGLPLKYLKDQKETLWQKYFELYPNGIKRTTFLTQLRDGPYSYKNDLGGLCLTCAEYSYNIFDNLKELIKNKIEHKGEQNKLIDDLEHIQRYLKREYEKELQVDLFGYTSHVECLEHCLQNAFGQCLKPHQSNCKECNKVSELFDLLVTQMPNDIEQIIENRTKLSMSEIKKELDQRGLSYNAEENKTNLISLLKANIQQETSNMIKEMKDTHMAISDE